MSKFLTKQLIIQKAKTDIMENIKSINLWGNDLEEISFIKELINLELAQLASNKINTMRDVVKCSNLKDLNLRNNIISNIEELQLLKLLPNLKTLTLLDNPITQHLKYRENVLKYAVHLEKLDDIVVTQKERQQIQKEEENQIKLKIYEDNQKIKKIDSKISKKKSQDKRIKQKENDIYRQVNQSYENSKQQYQICQILDEQQQEMYATQLYEQQDNQYSHENNNKLMILEKRIPKQYQITDKMQEEEIPFQQTTQQSKLNQNSDHYTASFQTSQNILCAILSLLEQLKKKEFEQIKKEVENKLYKDIS